MTTHPRAREMFENNEVDIQIFTDGGFDSGLGTAGIALIAWDRRDNAIRTLVHIEGNRWEGARSAFQAELYAIERAIEILMAFCTGGNIGQRWDDPP